MSKSTYVPGNWCFYFFSAWLGKDNAKLCSHRSRGIKAPLRGGWSSAIRDDLAQCHITTLDSRFQVASSREFRASAEAKSRLWWFHHKWVRYVIMLEGEREWLSRNRWRPLAGKNNAHPASHVLDQPLSRLPSSSIHDFFTRKCASRTFLDESRHSRWRTRSHKMAEKAAVGQARSLGSEVLFPFRLDDVSSRVDLPSTANRFEVHDERT